MIPVTKPFLPPKEAYKQYLDGIWERNWLTNNGPNVKALEANLKNYLNLENFLFTGNGTIAIQIAIKALNLKGRKIITTPFSYVATTSSIVWEGFDPIFVDIDKDSFNIDPNKIEDAITDETSAILATHVFGNPCNVLAIEKIAHKHGLKVIYDAAHAFAVTHHNRSVFEYGDISTTSFHATKLFHTIEGGGMISTDTQLNNVLMSMRNFGHSGPEQFSGVGINGKNSEFHASMGLLNLNYIDEILLNRKKQYNQYLESLKNVHQLSFQKILNHTSYNFSYFPIVFENENITLSIIEALNKAEVFPRRYFYPSLSSLEYVVKQKTPISDKVAESIICLPLYHTLEESNIEMICDLIKKNL